jgi:hypothetical protein
MKAVEQRIHRLEERFTPRALQQMVLVVHNAGSKLTLDNSVCLQILRDAGHLDEERATSCVDFGKVPDGLNAAELKQHLLENGHKLVSQSRWRS